MSGRPPSKPVPRPMMRPKATSVIKQEPGTAPMPVGIVGGQGLPRGPLVPGKRPMHQGQGMQRGGRGGGGGGRGGMAGAGGGASEAKANLMPQMPENGQVMHAYAYGDVKEERTENNAEDALEPELGGTTALAAAEQMRRLAQSEKIRAEQQALERLKKEKLEEESYESTLPSLDVKAVLPARKWQEVNHMWEMGRDALEPLRYPYVPHDIERVDSAGVLRHFFPAEGQNNWASLENNADQDTMNRHCVVFQMPATLPVKVASDDDDAADLAAQAAKKEGGAEEVTADPDAAPMWVQHMSNPFATVKTGKIGKLVVHKSGRAYLKLNGRKFDVSPGFNRGCVESFHSISAEQKKMFNIAGAAGHVVITPDLDTLLSSSK